MAAHFPLAPEPLANGVGVFAREVFGQSAGKCWVEPMAGAYRCGTDGRRGKSAGRPEGGFVHECQFPGLVPSGRIALQVVDAEVPNRAVRHDILYFSARVVVTVSRLIS
jgi:hypothetical protein